MSAKKSFSIAPDLASGIRNTVKTASSNSGQINYDMMSLDVIETDPENPRKLTITRDDLLQGLRQTDPSYPIKLKELEALQQLAESIKQVGIRNAIEVYKEGVKYRIISGERRYWAAILARQTTVPTRISQKPDEFKLRYTQWVENINREDLSLWEKYNNLVTIANAHQQATQLKLTPKSLGELLGTSTAQTYRYFSLLNAEREVVELIRTGKLINLKIIAELENINDPIQRKQILSGIQENSAEATSFASFKSAVKESHAIRNKKNKSMAISLGKIKDLSVAKHLFDIIIADPRLLKYQAKFHHLDWASPKSINAAFGDIIKLLKHEVAM